MTTLADRLRNHVTPSRAEMAAYADEVEVLEAKVARVEALADSLPRTSARSPRMTGWVTHRRLRTALDGTP